MVRERMRHAFMLSSVIATARTLYAPLCTSAPSMHERVPPRAVPLSSMSPPLTTTTTGTSVAAAITAPTSSFWRQRYIRPCWSQPDRPTAMRMCMILAAALVRARTPGLPPPARRHTHPPFPHWLALTEIRIAWYPLQASLCSDYVGTRTESTRWISTRRSRCSPRVPPILLCGCGRRRPRAAHDAQRGFNALHLSVECFSASKVVRLDNHH